MTADTRNTGGASAEYLALIAVVISLFIGLLVLRPQTVSRKPPVDVITPIARLLAAPVTPRPVRVRTPAPRPRPRIARPRPQTVDPTILLPQWWSR